MTKIKEERNIKQPDRNSQKEKGTIHTWGDKRYNTFNRHLREVFGEKVIKVSLDVGLSCPNRDGTISRGGCVFCSAKGSGDFAGERHLSIPEQFIEVRERTKKKWPQAKYLAYFQSFTGTYGPVDYLKEMYYQALEQENVVGISISTRPDCITEEILATLEELNKKTYLWVELGLQSVHDKTLDWINRGHGYACFLTALAKLREKNIRVCVHVILGLPCESLEEMLTTAKAVSELPIQGIKLHSLHVLKNTPLAVKYRKEKFGLLTMEEYISLAVDFVEMLPENIIIHRLMGDGPAADVIAPDWTRKKWEVLNGIDAEMKRRQTWQGKKYKKITSTKETTTSNND